MYPLVRIDKLHPDGSPRAAWLGYRLPDIAGWARVWAPPHTPRAHTQWGGWTAAEPLLTALSTAERFVPSLYWDSDGFTFSSTSSDRCGSPNMVSRSSICTWT